MSEYSIIGKLIFKKDEIFLEISPLFVDKKNKELVFAFPGDKFQINVLSFFDQEKGAIKGEEQEPPLTNSKIKKERKK